VLPASDHADSVYFYASVAALAEWDPGGTDVSAPAVDPDGRGAHCQVVVNSAGAWAGMYTNAIPADARWTFTAPIRHNMVAGVVTQQMGIFVSEDLAAAPTTSNMWTINFTVAAASDKGQLNFQQFSDYNSYLANTELAHTSDWASFHLFRLYVDTVAETVEALVSRDGSTWIKWGGTRTTFGLTIASVGVAGMTNPTADSPMDIYAEFFQFRATSDKYHPTGGLVTIA